MSTSQDVVDLRARRTGDPAVAELRDEWGRLSRSRLGLSRQQWHHPAAADLLRAVLGGHDVEGALVRLGEARATAGLSLDETLADLGVLDELLRTSGRPTGHLDSLVTAVAAGTAWVDTRGAGTQRPTCVDELTGLVTAPFLEARIEQIYRHCSYLGMRPNEAYALVVAQLGRHDPSPFTRVAQRLRLAGDLRLCFPGSDTLAVLEPGGSSQTMVALTSRDPELPAAVEGLRFGAGHRQVWIETLPTDVGGAVSLVRHLPSCNG